MLYKLIVYSAASLVHYPHEPELINFKLLAKNQIVGEIPALSAQRPDCTQTFLLTVREKAFLQLM